MIKFSEGKSKKLYSDGNHIVMEFKGDVRCSTQKVQYDVRIAKLRALFTYKLYCVLNQEIKGVLLPDLIDEKTLRMEKVVPIALEWIPRFIAAGTVVKRFGFKEGYVFKNMVLKIDYKSNEEDYLITDELIIERGLLTWEELGEAKALCKEVALFLRELFRKCSLELWDFKMELGKTEDGRIVLMDEISLDGMRLKDMYTNRDFDKDVYRKTGNLELLIKAYEDGFKRIFHNDTYNLNFYE